MDEYSIDATTPAAIRRLAYSHLATTLLRKEHTFPDVQATLILAVWGLLPNGKGPDPWVLTGHCQRMGQRLGLHKLFSLSAAASIPAWGVSEETDALDRHLTKLKTYLSCYQ